MELYPADLLLHVVNIVVLYVLLRLILFKPVSRYLAARAERIQNKLNEAEDKLKEAEKMKLEYKRQLDTVAEQGHEIIRESQTTAAQEAKTIIADAYAQAEMILAEAHEKVAKEKELAMERMRREVAQLSVDIAARILKREVNTEDNRILAENFFSEMRKK